MPTKTELITAMYQNTLTRATSGFSEWAAFLRSASRNYKLPFTEQILVHAQRPNATAVLPLDVWNNHFGRWVNYGAKGIAVVGDSGNIKHYFDIADTHQTDFSRPVPIWEARPEDHSDIITTLENTFGELAEKSTLEQAIVSATKNAALDQENIDVACTNLLQNSVAFAIVSRCGLDPTKYFTPDDFADLANLNTPEIATTLGVATSAIAQTGLREIAKTIQKRTFDKSANAEYNKSNHQPNRSISNDIHRKEWLSAAKPRNAEQPAAANGQIRTNAQRVSSAAQESRIHELADERRTEPTSDRDRANGDGALRATDRANDESTGSERTVESSRPNGVGGSDEQYPKQSGRSDTKRIDNGEWIIDNESVEQSSTKLNLLPKGQHNNYPLSTVNYQLKADEQSSAFAIFDIVNKILTSGSNKQNSILQLITHFRYDHNREQDIDFLQSVYGEGGKGFTIDSKQYAAWWNDVGIIVAEGNRALKTPGAMVVSWEFVAKDIRKLLENGEFAPQSEIDKVGEFEFKTIAEHLCYAHREISEDCELSFLDENLFSDDLSEKLKDESEREKILSNLEVFNTAYEQNNEILRPNFAVNHLKTVLTMLRDLQHEPKEFTAKPDFTPLSPSFITEDEIDFLFTGSHFERKFRFYEFFKGNYTLSEAEIFLKDYYGLSGSGYSGYHESHDSKGTTFARGDGLNPYDTVILPWSKVAKRIETLIKEKRFLSENELAEYPNWCEQKELKEIARKKGQKETKLWTWQRNFHLQKNAPLLPHGLRIL